MNLFKKLLNTAICISLMVSGNAIAKPSDFKVLNETRTGVKTYIDGYNSFTVIEIPLCTAQIKFGMSDKKGMEKRNPTFENISIKKHYEEASKKPNLYMVLNGQFYRFSGGPLSFSTKVDSQILKKGVEEAVYDKWLLFIMDVVPLIYYGSQNLKSYEDQQYIEKILLQSAVQSGIVGLNTFDQDVKKYFGWDTPKGRHMVGCKTNSREKGNIVICDTLYFFVAKKRSARSMVEEMNSWGIQDRHIMRMDGSGSAQAYTERFNLKFYGDGRSFPNSILIYTLQ